MDDRRAKKLAQHLDRLRLTLLALETYMAQVRDLIAVAQDLIDGGESGPKPPKRPVARK